MNSLRECINDLSSLRLWEDFTSLVPFLDLALQKLQAIGKVVMRLEEDLSLVPVDIDSEKPVAGADTMASVFDASPSITALWQEEERAPQRCLVLHTPIKHLSYFCYRYFSYYYLSLSMCVYLVLKVFNKKTQALVQLHKSLSLD